MFDPSFFELIVICIVALVVLGPERLPGAIKTLGLWIGRLRRSFNNIKREIEQEVGADEIRRQLRNEAIMEKFNNTKSQISNSIESVKSEAESIKNDLDLTKNVSGKSDNPENSSSGNTENTADPMEKLATNDPAARKTNPAVAAKVETDNKDQKQTKTPDSKNSTGAEQHSQSAAKDNGAAKPDKTKE